MNRVRAAVAAAVAAVTLFTGAAVASADPQAVEQARLELERIQQESSAIDQQIIEAYDRAGQAEKKLERLRADVQAQEERVDKLATQLGDVAAFQMQHDSVSLAAQLLFSSSSENFLSGLATLHSEVDRNNSGIQQLQLVQAKLTTLREDTAATEAALKQEHAAKIQLGKDYDAKEAEAEAVYNRLSEEERQRLARIEAERQRRAEDAQRRAEAARAARDRDPAAAGQAADAEGEPASAPAASGRAQDVVSAALSKVGSRYVWGTSGERTFDCSGLTSWAYRQVGVNLSRSSRTQWNSAGYKISKSELRPGDLVFYYSPVSHVGIYIGNGKIVDAANPRTGVRVTSLNSMPFSGARRVIG
ncbi:MAG: NlpC/P60 family protein [Propionibacteriaceae bacterium]|nr:NlpC/P60 family protein [Propionibacteriaceae bacterium]